VNARHLDLPAAETAPAQTWVLAHLSDLHLTEPVVDSGEALRVKQRFGLASWRNRRSHLHQGEVLHALTVDLRAQAPDRIAISGDLVQVGTRDEFQQAARWLAGFASPEQVLLVPGNHEAYVPGTWERGRDAWQPYLPSGPDGGPWLVRHEGLLLIGLGSAVPSAPGLATGTLGKTQLAGLEAALAQGTRENRFRVVVLHHPPAGQVSWRKRLTDQRRFAAIIARHGAGLILHGHSHRATLSSLPGAAGPVPVVGAPAASALDARPGRMAGYGLLRITRAGTAWHLRLDRRVYRPSTRDFACLEQCHLPTHG
jgi:3',5'-cyclic AMP phosphodiesterase CpdA